MSLLAPLLHKITKKKPRSRYVTYQEYVNLAQHGYKRQSVGYLSVSVKRKGSDTWETLCKDKHNLGTVVGQDLLHRVLYINIAAESSGWGANYIALSTNASGADPSHTSVAGEITTNGLARVGAASLDVRNHSATTNTSTLEHTFTASGAHSNVQLTGLLNNTVASGTSILTHENTFTATTLASGDELKVTWTITSTFTP